MNFIMLILVVQARVLNLLGKALSIFSSDIIKILLKVSFYDQCFSVLEQIYLILTQVKDQVLVKTPERFISFPNQIFSISQIFTE